MILSVAKLQQSLCRVLVNVVNVDIQYTNGITLTCLSKAGQPDYKPADRFINRRPVYKLVRFTIGSQHICAFALITCTIITSRTLLPCDLTRLRQFRQLLCITAMSGLPQLQLRDGYREAEAT